MADDLVERLRIKADMIHLGETIAWGSDVALMHEAVARITDLEARLAAAEAEIIRLEQEALRLREELLEQRGAKAEAAAMMREAEGERDAAEAGEDAMAEAVRRFVGARSLGDQGVSDWFSLVAALAAYEARRKG